MTTATVGVAVITHNSVRHLPHSLPPLINSPLKPKILVVNSSSHDGSVELAQAMGVETHVLPTAEYNHGTTREIARQQLGTDIAVMMTPDAYAIDSGMLQTLIVPIDREEASIAYARQIPHIGADLFEAFPREFNYPITSHIRGIDDVERYGSYTFFCSNSCAAYSNRALDAIGGFPPVLLGEDSCVTAKLLQAGHKIAYVAEAIVRHSHRYSLREEFQRYFDTGLARKSYEQLLAPAGSDSGRGGQFLRAFLKRVAREQPALLPYALLHTAAKWLGYQLGRTAARAPTSIKKRLSSQKFYWSSNSYLGGTT